MQESFRVFVGAALPRTLRIPEIHGDVRGDGKAAVLRQLETSIPGPRRPQARRESLHFANKGVHDRCRILAGVAHEMHIPRLSLDACRNMGVLGTGQEIAFPMPRDGPILDARRPFGNGYRIDNLPARVARLGCSLAAPQRPSRPQMRGECSLQRPPGLCSRVFIGSSCAESSCLSVAPPDEMEDAG